MKAEFNWITFLERAIKKQPSKREHDRIKLKSENWPTCACGQLCKSLPRENDGEPIDIELSDLGLRFSHDVKWGSWSKALRIFHRIENRTAKLLKEAK